MVCYAVWQSGIRPLPYGVHLRSHPIGSLSHRWSSHAEVCGLFWYLLRKVAQNVPCALVVLANADDLIQQLFRSHLTGKAGYSRVTRNRSSSQNCDCIRWSQGHKPAGRHKVKVILRKLEQHLPNGLLFRLGICMRVTFDHTATATTFQRLSR